VFKYAALNKRGDPPSWLPSRSPTNLPMLTSTTTTHPWLMGFVSDFNIDAYDNSTPQIQGSDLAALDLWMRSWCNQNPTKSVLPSCTGISERDDGAVTATERA
jgi:hypothetical protein